MLRQTTLKSMNTSNGLLRTLIKSLVFPLWLPLGLKPAGLNSGEAQREYMNIQSDRFAAMQKRYQDFYPEFGLQND